LPKKRITITLDEELDRKIRNCQVYLIEKTNKGWSYSAALQILIEQGLKTKLDKIDVKKF
jgi:hypothetical protein